MISTLGIDNTSVVPHSTSSPRGHPHFSLQLSRGSPLFEAVQIGNCVKVGSSFILAEAFNAKFTSNSQLPISLPSNIGISRPYQALFTYLKVVFSSQ